MSSSVIAADKDDDQASNDVDYALPSILEKFDRRWDLETTWSKQVDPNDLRKSLSLKEFCDRFNVSWKRWNKDEDAHLHFTERLLNSYNAFHPITLIPHITKADSNHKSKNYPYFCKHLTLWLTPCRLIKDLFPKQHTWKSGYK